MDEHLNDLCTFLSTVRDPVTIIRCEFDLKLEKIPHRISHSKSERLDINDCELNINWIKRFLGFVKGVEMLHSLRRGFKEK